MNRDLHVVILAGGSGSRAVADDRATPKQFVAVAGRPLVMWSVAALSSLARVASVTLTCPDPWRDFLTEQLAAAAFAAPWSLAPAGQTRLASTRSALAQLHREHRPADRHLVAVHDAARPFATASLLESLVAAADIHDGAVPGVAVADTTVEVAADGADVRYLERARLRAVQTPQVFRWAPLFAAHERAHVEGVDFTDDGGLMAAAGAPPVVIAGEPANWKVTTTADLARAASLLGGEA